jgi:AraC-like DNA-binding protein
MKDMDFSRLKTTFQHQVFEESCRADHKISKAYRTNKLHNHDVFEIMLCLSDNIFLLNNNIISLLQKNDLILFNDMDIHGIIADPDLIFDRMVLIFEPDFIGEFRRTFDLLGCFRQSSDKVPHICHLTPEQADFIISFYNNLAEYNEDNSDIAKLKKKLILAEMLLKINILFDESAKQKIDIRSDPQYEKIQRILSYINDNLAGDLSLDVISRQFYISTSYLSALFKEITGYSLNNYIINKRILLATELLKQNHTVTSVTESCGFNNYSHFIRTFKKFEGIAPKQYAMRCRKNARRGAEVPKERVVRLLI